MKNMVNVSFKVDKVLKLKADILFEKLGLTTSDALILFLRECVLRQSIPFDINGAPSEKLLDAINEVENIELGKIKAKKYKCFEEALEDIK